MSFIIDEEDVFTCLSLMSLRITFTGVTFMLKYGHTSNSRVVYFISSQEASRAPLWESLQRDPALLAGMIDLYREPCCLIATVSPLSSDGTSYFPLMLY